MFFFVMLMKPLVWFLVFRSGIGSDRNGMLLRAAGIALFLTVVDKFTIADNLPFSAILLTLLLYTLMSFILLPVAWKAQKATVTVLCGLLGIVGASAGVNFTMDFFRVLFLMIK